MEKSKRNASPQNISEVTIEEEEKKKEIVVKGQSDGNSSSEVRSRILQRIAILNRTQKKDSSKVKKFDDSYAEASTSNEKRIDVPKRRRKPDISKNYTYGGPSYKESDHDVRRSKKDSFLSSSRFLRKGSNDTDFPREPFPRYQDTEFFGKGPSDMGFPLEPLPGYEEVEVSSVSPKRLQARGENFNPKKKGSGEKEEDDSC